MPQRLESAKSQLENLYTQIEEAKREVGKPFPQENELIEKESRLALVNAQLDIDGGENTLLDERDGEIDEMDEDAMQAAESAKTKKPSILEGLRSGVYDGINVRPGELVNRTKSHELSI